MSDFSVSPYFDDFSESKKFVKILYRPGYAVQARELNQMQTIIQNQIERFGRNVFKEGSVVIPGGVSVDSNISYVRLQQLYLGHNADLVIADLVGSTIISSITGIKALVVAAEVSNVSDAPTLMIKYLTSGTAGAKVFVNSDILVSDTSTISGTIQTVQAVTTGIVTGDGTVAHGKAGVYFVRGYFVLVEDQVAIIEKYSAAANYRIGFDVVEDTAIPETDVSLLDNANGEYNYAAPGAHRYVITLKLSKRLVGAADTSDFIEQIRTNIEGSLLKDTSNTSTYNEVEKTLANRTYDESGDYAVTPFKLQIREHRNNNRGTWASGTAYLIGDVMTNSVGNKFTALNSGTSGVTEPNVTSGTMSDGIVTWNFDANPSYNRGIYTPALGGDVTQYAIGVDAAKAYVRGHAIEKLGLEYIPVPKARTTNAITNDIIPSKIGDYFLVTNMNGLPESTKFGAVQLFNQLTSAVGTSAGTLVGTANIRGIEYHSGTVGTQAAIYKMYLFNVVMNTGYSFGRDVKQIFNSTGSSITSLSADVSFATTTSIQLTGSITAAGTAVTGNGTLFTTQLKVGDYLVAGGTSGRVTVITSNTALTIAAATITATNLVGYRLQTATPEVITNTSLVFPLHAPFIKTVRGWDGSNYTTYKTSYSVTQRFVATSNVSGVLSFNIASTTDTTTAGSEFSYADTSKIIVINNATGAIVSPSSITGTTSTMNINGVGNTIQYTVFAKVLKAGANALEKTKTKVSNATVDFTTAATAGALILNLGKADVIRVVKIEQATAFGAYSSVGATAIVGQFSFNNGQTESAYNQSFIQRLNAANIPTGTIRVTFDYYSHGAGDYFSADSYVGIAYSDIPAGLSDVLDFRPRVADGTNVFTGTGSSLTQIPKFGSDVVSDYVYYLGRIDKITLDGTGVYSDVMGIPSLSPEVPNDLANAMTVAILNIPPYGKDVIGVAITPVDNKRYTMRDIGRIDKRVDNLEYYTALSLLEHETNNMKITDDLGLDRYKNGFLTDSFVGQGIGDAGNVDFSCAIDMENRLLRPHFDQTNLSLIEKNTTDIQRTANGYAITGTVATLPYSHVEMVKQSYATRTEFVTPYMMFVFNGNISMNPSTDSWFDETRRPDIITNVEGNFNAVRQSMSASGALSTVWNSWQTTWSGSKVDSTGWIGSAQPDMVFVNSEAGGGEAWVTRAVFNQMAGIGGWISSIQWANTTNWSNGATAYNTTTTTTTTNQARTGVTTSVIPKVDMVQTSDGIVYQSAIPFIRTRNVKVVAKGMRPNTTLHCQLELIPVDEDITPASVLEIAAIVSKGSDFDTASKAGADAENIARKTAVGYDTAYDEGDIVYVSKRGGTSYASPTTSVATAIAGLEETYTGVTNKRLHLLNIQKGSFLPGDEITGSISGANVTIVTITSPTKGSALTTSIIGNVCGTLNISNTNAKHFRTGVKIFTMTDIGLGGAASTASTSAATSYSASGMLNTWQRQVSAVRNAQIVKESVSDTRTLTSVSTDTQYQWPVNSDPLAQTFLCDVPGGAFVTKLDLFFAQKDSIYPVRVEIRDVVNGYPGPTVLAFGSVVLNPSQVNVDPTGAAVATTVTFPSPVYLSDSTQYCIVILSDSTNYKVWISQLGEQEVGSTRFVTSQPSLGSLFKSQNNSTWTADQMQDLKFTLYRASFVTNTIGYLNMINMATPISTLNANPFRTLAGSNVVRISHYHHGIPTGGKVTLAGASGTMNGLTTGNLTGDFVVSNVTLDTYTVVAGANASSSGICGGSTVTASNDIQYDVINPIINVMDFQDTNISYTLSGYTGKTVGGAETPYIVTSAVPLIVNNNNILGYPQVVAAPVNEPLDGLLNHIKTLNVQAQISTTNEALSPVVDMGRTSAVLINNRVYGSVSTDNTATDTITIATGKTDISFLGNTLTCTVSATKAAFLSARVGCKINVTGSASNNTALTITAIASDGSTMTVLETLVTESAGASVSITEGTLWVSNVASGATSASKYLTKQVDFANASSFMKVAFAVACPPEADVDVYYKFLPVGATQPMDTLPFVSATGLYTVTKSQTNGKFIDVSFELPSQSSFISTVVKLVLRSTSSSRVPMVKDLRIIACA